ncbi:hypothetical protein ABZV14_01140 [Streptosporangium canum]|uniref:hypothetical protein n=1 Tax=Streptosporangium canum TaxID=324952 RepID=UPI0033B5DB74
MEPTVPNPTPPRHPACHLPWCRNDHAGTPVLSADVDVVHTAFVADFELDRNLVEIRYRQEQVAGRLQTPVLRVLYGPDWAACDSLDIPLAAAGALGDILALLDIRSYAEFGAALTRGSKGPGQAKAVTW